MSTSKFDAIVVGSGAGGSAATYRLVNAGLKVLLIEKGDKLAVDGSTLNVEKVVLEGHFKSREFWHDGDGRSLVPEEYFNLGGKTKWYGAALLRFADREFGADDERRFRGWPFPASDMRSYYEELEALLRVRHFDCEPDLARIVGALSRRNGWKAEPLPLGLAPEILDHPEEAKHFDGFASIRALKSDAETALLSRVLGKKNLTVITGQAVSDLLAVRGNTLSVHGVALQDGRQFKAGKVLLAGGALHSPRILQRFMERNEATRRLPAYANVGRNLKLHLLTALLAVSPRRKSDLLRKTTLLTNERFPNSSVQPLGFDGELISGLVPRIVPRFIARQIGSRAYGFFLQTEDASHADNRIADSDVNGGEGSLLDYKSSRSAASLREHKHLVYSLCIDLARAGYLGFWQGIPVHGTAHACGTLIAGNDPATSVVDANGCVHGLQNLYVVDGSILPRSSRVNPSLTIYAWALRVADALLKTQRAAA